MRPRRTGGPSGIVCGGSAASTVGHEDLAERSGMHRTYITGVERRQRNASLDAIHALALGLQVDVSLLFSSS